MLSVPQNHIADISDAETVNQNRPYRHLTRNLRILFIHLQHVAGLYHKDMILRNPQFIRDLCLRFPMLVLTVNRHRIPGFHQTVDQLDLLLTGMSRHVYILEDHVRAFHLQFVDHVRDRLLIPRNRMG